MSPAGATSSRNRSARSSPPQETPSAVDAVISAVVLKPAHLSALYTTLVEVLSPATPDRTGDPGPQPGQDHDGGPLAGDVLLVEDNELNQVVGAGILTELGLTVDIAADGQQAVIMTAHHTYYDAILMDCHMPVRDGFTATAEIRRHEGHEHHTPIIALTTAALPEDQARCAAAGMDDYLTKPITPESVEQHLRRWLPRHTPPTSRLSPVDQARTSMTARLTTFRKVNGEPNRQLQKHMLTVLVDTMPEYRRELAAAFADHDTARLAAIAHTLKGLGQTAGATQLATIGENLEALARTGQDSPITDLDHAAEATLQAARQILAAET